MLQEQEYLITFLGKEERKSIRLLYRNGQFAAVTIPETEQYTIEQLSWLCNWLRSQLSEDALHTNAGDATSLRKFRVAKIDPNLDFDSYWDAFAHKIGNKARAEKLWKNMSKDQKIHCLIGVRNYNYWLSLHPNTEKVYPETFLHQRRWENEYKI